MKVGILGASGFIGRHLSAALRARGDDVVSGSLREPAAAAHQMATCDAVVNLAGEPVAQRWTKSSKERMEASRTSVPRAFLDALSEFDARPLAYVSASAVGYYGTSESAHFTEQSPPGTDFLAQLCVAWEREAQRAAELGMRVSCVRTGFALGSDGGAMAKILPPFKLGAGGPLASGQQWHSWIHIDDVVGIYVHALDGATGVLNATAPNPVRNKLFTKELGTLLHRPTFFKVPSAAIAAVLGEGAYVVTEGQYVLPQRTVSTGYAFRFSSIHEALRDLLSSRK
ncbi:MAG: TIGR01777 family protein [Candidatus Meridianibacter frigidus]|nr:MAG: TIGR01777 family protein [Candidatus Eremiobacteraeota bacterium]